MHSQIEVIKNEISCLGSPAKAVASSRFFKTGPGEYGEGDKFLGVSVPQMRVIAKRHLNLSIDEVTTLLQSPEHEFRMTALLIWTYQAATVSGLDRKRIFDCYLSNTIWINNWDLIDASCPEIVGGFLFDGDRSVLDELAKSDLIWERRIAIVSSFFFINRKQPEDTLRIAALLLSDKEDLIHKATGWMLREVGKRCSQQAEEEFLQAHYKAMPRTMLRYAIERFDPQLKLAYMAGTV